MERILRPKELSINPDVPDAAKIFKFWLRTIEDFIEGLSEERGENAPAINKKRIIISFLSPEVYPYVEDAESYEDVVAALKRTFIKRKNNVYARHLLVSRRQGPEETIAEYLQALKHLAKECSFTDVTADQFRDQLIRDSFINGLSSTFIRQRLLENDELTLDRAYDMADNLDMAYKQSLSIEKSTHLYNAVITERPFTAKGRVEELKEVVAMNQPTLSSTKKQKQCYFCGGPIHASRRLCPAKNEINSNICNINIVRLHCKKLIQL